MKLSYSACILQHNMIIHFSYMKARQETERLTGNILCSVALPHLWRCWCLSVAGQDLECDAATAAPQQLLEFMGVGVDLATVHLADYVPCVQHALPVNRAAVQDPSDHHLPLLHAERDSLKESRSH